MKLFFLLSFCLAPSANASDCILAGCTYWQDGVNYYSRQAAVSVDGGQATDCNVLDNAIGDMKAMVNDGVCKKVATDCSLGFSDASYNLSINDTIVETYSDSANISENVAAGKAKLAKLVKSGYCKTVN